MTVASNKDAGVSQLSRELQQSCKKSPHIDAGKRGVTQAAWHGQHRHNFKNAVYRLRFALFFASIRIADGRL
jgi:hypothetical protein